MDKRGEAEEEVMGETKMEELVPIHSYGCKRHLD